MLNSIMALSYDTTRIISIVLLAIMALCALFIIIVVVMQPGNSSGVSALGGNTDTFLSKNRGKTFESKMKRMTVIASILFAVMSIAYFILQIVL